MHFGTADVNGMATIQFGAGFDRGSAIPSEGYFFVKSQPRKMHLQQCFKNIFVCYVEVRKCNAETL